MGRTSILLQINSKSSAIRVSLSASAPVYFQTTSRQLRRSVPASASPSNAVSSPQATDQLRVLADLTPGVQPGAWEPRAPSPVRLWKSPREQSAPCPCPSLGLRNFLAQGIPGLVRGLRQDR